MEKRILSYDSLHDLFIIYYPKISYLNFNNFTSKLHKILECDYNIQEAKNIILEKYPLIYDHIDFSFTYKTIIVSKYIKEYRHKHNKYNETTEQITKILLGKMRLSEYTMSDYICKINCAYDSDFPEYVCFKNNILRTEKLNRILNN